MDTLKRCIRNAKFVVSLAILIPLASLAIFGPCFIRNDPRAMNTKEILKPASEKYPLGTDEFGRSIASRLVMGIRPSLGVALLGTAIALTVGLAVGVIGAYIGGRPGGFLMRAIEVILCFPPILLAMIVVGLWGPGVRNLTIAVGILYSPHFARLAYASTLQIRGAEFVENDISIGSSPLRVMVRSILPNIMSPIMIQVSLTIANAILIESGLSFLGLGVQPPDPSWGQMIGDAKNYLSVNLMYMVYPAFLLSLLIIAVNLFGDALRDILDPKLTRSL
jgi:peptide/nickel transport system permease protein